MFGYIKIKKEELLVKDYALYKSVYCGLCREIKKNVSYFLSFGLSYDFVFLAIARDMISSGEVDVCSGRCVYNPLKKAPFASSDGIRFASKMAALLVCKNLEDKRRDHDIGAMSPFLAIAELYLKRKVKKICLCEPYSSTWLEINQALREFSRLEKERADIDVLALSFGEVMAKVLSAGLEDDERRIAVALGQAVGAWLYLADAADDIDKDYKKGTYNPLIEQYKTPDTVRENFRDIDICFGAWARDAHLALSLAHGKHFGRIADNILTLGMGDEAYRIMNKRSKK
jgi:hypothetical protein